MGKIVSINAGSTSIKMAIYDDFAIQDGQTTPLAEYRWEKDVKKATVKFGVHKYVHDVPFESHTEAFKDGINRFKRAKSFKYSNEIIAVVNRAVNGGELLQSPDPIEITTEVQKEFERNIDLAPNHNPPALEVSKAAQKLFYGAKHYYMFDTGWHSTMPIMNQLYALPKECFEEVGIRAFGAHGIVYMDNTKRAAQKLNISEDKVNLILLHLGGGCSANAVKNGKSIDTTMGYTPTDGLMMATRCGHIDPGVFPKLVEYYGSVKKVMEVMTKKSGFYGLTGEADMRLVKKLAEEGDEMANVAIERFINEVRKVIGAYMAELDYEVDAIVCSGGIAENDTEILRRIFEGYENVGLSLSKDNTKITDEECCHIPVMVIQANEELAMAKAVLKEVI